MFPYGCHVFQYFSNFSVLFICLPYVYQIFPRIPTAKTHHFPVKRQGRFEVTSTSSTPPALAMGLAGLSWLSAWRPYIYIYPVGKWVPPIGSLPFKYRYFPLNHDYGRKSIHVNYMGVEPKIVFFSPPNHPFVHRVFHEIHHPFSGTIIFGNKHIYIYGYWVKSVPHGTAFINCTCMFEGYINLPSTHIYPRHS